jgi:hypothetical protein
MMASHQATNIVDGEIDSYAAEPPADGWKTVVAEIETKAANATPAGRTAPS